MKENWKYKKLGEIASFSRGLTYSKNDVADYSTKKVLRSNNIDLDTNSLNLNDIAYLNDDFVIPGDKKLHKNNIFICMSNGSTQHLGKVAFIKDDLEYAFGGFMGSIIPNSNETEPKYVFYSCLSKEYRRFLKTVLNGININNLKWSDLKNFSIPVPPLPLQQQIVAELDLLSVIIEKQKQQLTELDKLAQATFYDMFGDPVTNEKGWEVKRLEEVAIEKLSYGSGASAIDYDGKLRYVRITDICDSGELNDDFKSPSSYDEKYLLNDGDILFARSGATVGKTYCHNSKNGKCIYAGYLIRMIPDRRLVLPKYIFHYTKSEFYNSFISRSQNAVAQPNINAKQYSDLIVPVPPLPLQQSFASKIEVIEKQKELINNSIEESQRLFDSRMEYWFG